MAAGGVEAFDAFFGWFRGLGRYLRGVLFSVTTCWRALGGFSAAVVILDIFSGASLFLVSFDGGGRRMLGVSCRSIF